VADGTFAQFGNEKYISLETFKRNGQSVKTPLWFVVHNDSLYTYTKAGTGKIKRIRNNPRVRVAPCTVSGRVTGPWIDGIASIVDGEEQRVANQLLDRKYFLKIIFNWLTRINRHQRAMIKIQAASPGIASP
jgi:PPOX class probable F420-dependent enzyme